MIVEIPVPSIRLEGLRLVRTALRPGRTGKDHAGQWIIFCGALEAPGGLVVSGDFHEVSEGTLLGGTAHAIVRVADGPTLSQEEADDAAEVLGPWLSEILWDFLVGYLRPLAGASGGKFDLPQKAPEPEIERLAELNASADG